MSNDVFTTYGTKGIREDLSDIIYNISPTDTPFISNVGKGTAKGTYTEWQVDSLSAATDNKIAEGAATPGATSDATQRVGNYTQIASKTAQVSGSNLAADAAGRDSEMAYQLAKAGMELKRDMEKTLVGTDKAQSSGAANLTRETASVYSWLATNCSVGTSGAAPSDNDGTEVYSAGTDRDLSHTILEDLVQDIWTEGGDPSMIMCGAAQKAKITAFTGNSNVARKFTDAESKKFINAVDVYVSDYGELNVVPNRLMLNDAVLVLQPDMWSVDYYRDFFTKDVPVAADAETKQIIVEYTLCSKNEAASGQIRDLNV